MAADGVLEYYKEQLEHGRHIEVQRSTVAGIAATISGAMIGELLKKPKLSREDLPYTVALLFVGLIALVLSAKLYERFRLHMEVAKLARNSLNPGLAEFRKEAQKTIKAKYPFLFWLKLHVVWNLLFACVSAIGLVTTLLALC
jgi:hypothetical protein